MRTGSVPQCQLNLLSVDIDVCYIVLEHCGDVYLQHRNAIGRSSSHEPPKTKWMILIWSWKILTPLLVYIFIQVVCSCVAVLYSVAGKGLPPLTVLARTGQGRHLRGIRGDGAEAVRGLAQPHLLSARSHAAATATRARPTQKHKTPSKAGPVPGIQASNIIRIITQRCALSLA